MFVKDQATAYPLGLHISRATEMLLKRKASSLTTMKRYLQGK